MTTGLVAGRLLAYDAEHFLPGGIMKVLWDSQTAWGINFVYNKFNPPVSGGKIFVPTYADMTDVYGLGDCGDTLDLIATHRRLQNGSFTEADPDGCRMPKHCSDGGIAADTQNWRTGSSPALPRTGNKRIGQAPCIGHTSSLLQKPPAFRRKPSWVIQTIIVKLYVRSPFLRIYCSMES